MSAPLQLVISPELTPHVARALAVHIRWCRDNGVLVADGLVEAQEWAEVVARGLSSPLPLPGVDTGVVEPLILTIPQTAEMLGCSATKVKTLIAAGQLPVVCFGGVRRVRRADVEGLVERLGSGAPFRDAVESKAPDLPASGRQVRRGASDAATTRQTVARSATLDHTRSSA